MADEEDLSDRPVGDPAAETAPGTAPEIASAAAPGARTRWRDRAWNFRAMVAVAVASLVIGGVAGGVIGRAAGGDDDHQRMHRWGPGAGMPPGWRRHAPRWGGNNGPFEGPNVGPGAPLTPYGTGGPTTTGPPTANPTPGAAG